MKKSLMRFFAMALVICMAMTYIIPATFAAGPASNAVVYDFHLQDDKNQVAGGYFPTNFGADAYYNQGIHDAINGFYADGTLNWKFAGASKNLLGESAADEHLPVGIRFGKGHTRFYTGVGDWVAFTIKSPGAGTYTLSLNYALSYNNGVVATYILPADTTDIIGATDPSNRVGISNTSDSTGTVYNDGNRDDKKDYQGYDAYVGTWNFEANKEYIVVFEVYKGSSFNGSGQMHLYGLEMSPGVVAESKFDQQPYGVVVGTELVKDNVIPVSDAAAMSAVWEVNGQDYYFLPIEGGRLLVFNLDTWELIDSVPSGIGYPSSTTVLEKDDGTVEVYVGGNGKKMFWYNPYTGEYAETPQYNFTEGLEDESALRGLYAHEGKVYIGLNPNGHLASYDPATRTYEDLGDMVVGKVDTETGEEGEEVDTTGGISAIACYGNDLYLTAGDATTYTLIHFDLTTKKVVRQWDVTSLMAGCSNSRGLAVLGNNDYLLAGGAGFKGLVMIDLATGKFVTNAEAKAMGWTDKSLISGANSSATQPINGKQYITSNNEGGLLSYDIATKKISYVGNASNGFVAAGKQWVTLKIDEATRTRSETAPTQLYLFTMANGGQPRLYNPSETSAIRGQKISFNDLMKQEYGTNGAQVRINTVGENGDNTKLYLGAFNTTLSAQYDVTTGEFTYYRTSGQTDSQIWYDGKLYAGNYSQCVVYEIDMENSDNNTPVIANMINYEQKRIHTLAAGDGYIFAGTIPTTYINGGGIGIYNIATGEEDFIRFKEASINGEKVVSNPELWDLSVKALVYSDGLLYGATTRSGGSSSTYVDGTSAQIFVYDYKNGTILDTLDLRDYIPDNLLSGAIDFIGGIAADPVVEGRFWGSVSDVVFTFSYDRAAGQWDVQLIHDFRHTKYETSGGRANWNLPITFDTENNSAYVSLSNTGTVCIRTDDWETLTGIFSEVAFTISPIFMEFGADNNLYYGSGADLRMYPLNLTDAEWAQARAWDTAVGALDLSSANYVAQVQTLRQSYDAMPVRVQLLAQNMREFQDAEAEALEKEMAAAIVNVSSDSLEELQVLMARYDAMTDRQKRYVKEYDNFQAAYDQANAYREEELVIAQQVQAQIDSLNVTSLADADAVAAARAAYNALNDRQKALVDATKLIAAEQLLAEYESAVNNVQSLIDALPERVSAEDKAAVDAARAAFEELPEILQAEIDTEKLAAAEERLQKLLRANVAGQVYDFKLYENEDYMQYISDTLQAAGATGELVYTDHNLYKYNYATGIYSQGYKWMEDAYLDQQINWAIEGAYGIASGNIGKDYFVNIASQTGLMLNFEKPTEATKNDFAGFRICVPDSGSYQIHLSLFEGGASNRLATGDVLEVYIFPAYENYYPAGDNYQQMMPYLTAENYVGDIRYITQSGATTTSTYTVSENYTFPEAGDYIIVIREKEIDTCRYVYLDALTLDVNVTEETAVAQVDGKYFAGVGAALEYQVQTGARKVALCNDALAEDLILTSGAVLDLNGYTLDADSVLTYESSAIIDSSEKSAGVLKIYEADGNMLDENNAQLPIYDAAEGGLRFFEISVKSAAITGKGSADPKYWFQVSCVSFDEIHKLIDAGSELNITVKMSWNGGEADAVAGADFLKQWADAFANNENIYITVSAVNTEGLESFSLTPCMAANGVTVKGSKM